MGRTASTESQCLYKGALCIVCLSDNRNKYSMVVYLWRGGGVWLDDGQEFEVRLNLSRRLKALGHGTNSLWPRG